MVEVIRKIQDQRKRRNTFSCPHSSRSNFKFPCYRETLWTSDSEFDQVYQSAHSPYTSRLIKVRVLWKTGELLKSLKKHSSLISRVITLPIKQAGT